MYHQEQIKAVAEIDDKMDAAKEQFLKNTELKQHLNELNRMSESLPIRQEVLSMK
jgi:hypothetical protein